MEFSRLSGREACPSSFFSFLAGDSVDRAFFNTAFLSFRFAAWESTGTSSVRLGSELDDESEDGSLFRFNFDTGDVDLELSDDDDISLALGRKGRVSTCQLGPCRPVKSNLIKLRESTEWWWDIRNKFLRGRRGGGELLYFP